MVPRRCGANPAAAGRFPNNQGLVKSTRNRRPLKLIYKEIFNTKKEAQNRERYFKGGGQARSLLTKLIKEKNL